MTEARLTLSVTLALSVFFSPLAAEAQQPEQIRRIGFLAAPTLSPANVDAFRRGLRENGYVEGRNLLIEWRSAEGQEERLPGLTIELGRRKVEVIVTEGLSAALAAKTATATTPIVFTFVPDPVASGLVAGLARPGGNITGVATLTVDLIGKRLELLKDAIPSSKSVALLSNPAYPASASTIAEAQIAARRLGLQVRLVEVRHLADLEPALTSIAHERAIAVVPVSGSFLFTHRMQIVELATKGRLPVLGWHRQWAETGALISYGPNYAEMLRRAASHVDKILKGAKPADIPVEQPTGIELIINMKTANALGLTIPRSLLLRADHVIE
jgi:putative ABC transport system substrate-binding protein